VQSYRDALKYDSQLHSDMTAGILFQVTDDNLIATTNQSQLTFPSTIPPTLQ